MNNIKTLLLLSALTGLILFIGQQMGGYNGLVMALGISLVMNIGSYWFSDKIVLATYGAKQIPESEAPQLYTVVRSLSQKANIPMPKVYLIPSSIPNAFATGRNPAHAAVAVTTGILERINEEELEGVLGHELSHVLHRDILISTVAAVMASAITFLARSAMWMGGMHRDRDDRGSAMVDLLLLMLAPFAAMLIQMAISRSREFDADKGGAELTGNPLALASALKKIAGDNDAAEVPLAANNPSTAHLFFANPLHSEGLFSLFSTHPATKERVARLQAMADSPMFRNPLIR